MEYNYYIKNNVREEIKTLKANGKAITAKNIENFYMSEVNVIAILGKVLENDKIYEGFVKLADIPEGANVEEVLLENRKKMMATIIDSFTKQCIKQNKLVLDEKPEQDLELKSINLIFNAVNNYYDSVYARYTNLDENKVLPEYNEQELVNLKYKSYKKIMNGVGVLGIQNEFKKSKTESFAQFCAEAAVHYVHKYNLAADKLLKEGIEQGDIKVVNPVEDSNVSELNPGDISISILNMDNVNKSNIEIKIPLMYDMLEKSYNARSTTERFFSYFPFINPTAKAERRAMNTIKNVMEEVCYNHMDLDELETKREKAVKMNAKKYYKEELEKLNYVEEEQKVPIEAHEVIQSEKVVHEIDDSVVKELLARNIVKRTLD